MRSLFIPECAALAVLLLPFAVLLAGPTGVGQTPPSPQELRLTILHPRPAAPAYLVRGDTLTVQAVLTLRGRNVTSDVTWVLRLARVGPLALTAQPAVGASYAGGLWRLTAMVDVPPGLYDVEVDAFASQPRVLQASDSEMHALAVVDRIPETIRLAHVTDLHIGDPRGAEEDLEETIGWKAAQQVISEMNLIRPDLVVMTGDLVFGQDYLREYPALMRILAQLEVPMVAVMGNHDGYATGPSDGYEHWVENLGPLYFTFDIGNLRLVGTNTYDWDKADRQSVGFAVRNWGGQLRSEQRGWIEGALSASTGKDLIVLGHHNPLWGNEEGTGEASLGDQNWNGEGRQWFRDVLAAYGVKAYLCGHVHRDDVTVNNGTLYITTTTAASSHPDGQYWGYRLINVSRGVVSDYDYLLPGRSIPSYSLSFEEDPDEGPTGDGAGYAITVCSGLEIDLMATRWVALPAGTEPVFALFRPLSVRMAAGKDLYELALLIRPGTTTAYAGAGHVVLRCDANGSSESAVAGADGREFGPCAYLGVIDVRFEAALYEIHLRAGEPIGRLSILLELPEGRVVRAVQTFGTDAPPLASIEDTGPGTANVELARVPKGDVTVLVELRPSGGGSAGGGSISSSGVGPSDSLGGGSDLVTGAIILAVILGALGLLLLLLMQRR